MEGLSKEVVAVVSTLVSGAGVYFVKWILDKNRRELESRESNYEVASSLRDELRKQTLFLYEEVRRLREEVDAWKSNYYNMERDYNGLILDNRELKLENKILKSDIEEIKKQLKENGVYSEKEGNERNDER